jgi:hypothetical protein
MGLQANANSANAGIAGQNAGAQAGLMGSMMGGIGSAMGMLGGGGGGAASAGGGLMAGGGDSIAGGASEMGSMLAARGGMIKKYADGGETEAFDPLMSDVSNKEVAPVNESQPSGPSSNVVKMFNTYEAAPVAHAASHGMQGPDLSKVIQPIMKLGKGVFEFGKHFVSDVGNTMAQGAADVGTGVGQAAPELWAGSEAAAPAVGEAAVMVAAKGGKVPALVSPGEIYLKPKDVKEVAKGKKSPLDGEKIPGKAKVKGAKNSYANDTVPKTLDEGGIILPRSVTQSKTPGKDAAAFVEAILAKQRKTLPKK